MRATCMAQTAMVVLPGEACLNSVEVGSWRHCIASGKGESRTAQFLGPASFEMAMGICTVRPPMGAEAGVWAQFLKSIRWETKRCCMRLACRPMDHLRPAACYETQREIFTEPRVPGVSSAECALELCSRSIPRVRK